LVFPVPPPLSFCLFSSSWSTYYFIKISVAGGGRIVDQEKIRKIKEEEREKPETAHLPNDII